MYGDDAADFKPFALFLHAVWAVSKVASFLSAES